MSNAEATIVENSEAACLDEAAAAGLELLLPREVPLGGPRAMSVQRVLPNKHRHFIGAWCFADAFGPSPVRSGADPAARGMEVPPHPHTGLQTWSWLVDGAIEHRDSAGFSHTVRPGGLNIMTAGRGIAHSEYSTPETTMLHGVQLWTVLPSSERQREPSFDGLDAVPQVQLADGVLGSVFVGEHAGGASDVGAYSPLLGVELRMAAGSEVRLELRAGFEHGVLALTEGVTVDDVRLGRGSMAYAAPGREAVIVSAAQDAIVILLGGEPFEEEVVMFWNFIGADHAEVLEAREQWMRERDSGTETRPRFGSVVDDASQPLAAPRLPAVELLPRGRAKRRA
ncbi:pirin family protein [Agrococcus sp. ARC_14]|uniref:pirin family protein n=1 Tax=Agrococcus sp. ARC_14 TaxID=2919927 RepID=UPI001F067FCA|nr:pirin family protein [Agrococcus sp. ARC_14]MCH1881656.1 pirin family protein [Agrococcus sp. ARC_14]